MEKMMWYSPFFFSLSLSLLSSFLSYANLVLKLGSSSLPLFLLIFPLSQGPSLFIFPIQELNKSLQQSTRPAITSTQPQTNLVTTSSFLCQRQIYVLMTQPVPSHRFHYSLLVPTMNCGPGGYTTFHCFQDSSSLASTSHSHHLSSPISHHQNPNHHYQCNTNILWRKHHYMFCHSGPSSSLVKKQVHYQLNLETLYHYPLYVKPIDNLKLCT